MGCGSSANTKVDDVPEFVHSNEIAVDFKPIHSAIRWNKSIQEVKDVLKPKGSVDIVDPGNGNRPIHIAGQNGHGNIVQLLIKLKADVNAQNQKGNTALHMALSYDYYDCCMMLIQAGADVNIKNSGDFPGFKGIDGDKSLHVCRLICATDSQTIMDALNACANDVTDVDKASFVSSGLKLKKSIPAEWTPEIDSRFKEIITMFK